MPELVDVPGATLWTESQGAGVPLVLCHGGPGLSDNLAPVAAMVDDLARVHRFDQRGGGRSRSDGPFDVDAMVADLEALRVHWGHERWVVGGHSWGACLALFSALAHPDRALGVVYVSGSGLRWGWQESARRLRMARLSEAEQAELANPASTERFLRLMWTTDFADRGRADAVLDRAPLYEFPRDERVFRAASASQRAKLEAGIEDAVARLDVPVLVVHGAEDTDPWRAREVAARRAATSSRSPAPATRPGSSSRPRFAPRCARSSERWRRRRREMPRRSARSSPTRASSLPRGALSQRASQSVVAMRPPGATPRGRAERWDQSFPAQRQKLIPPHRPMWRSARARAVAAGLADCSAKARCARRGRRPIETSFRLLFAGKVTFRRAAALAHPPLDAAVRARP